MTKAAPSWVPAIPIEPGKLYLFDDVYPGMKDLPATTPEEWVQKLKTGAAGSCGVCGKSTCTRYIPGYSQTECAEVAG